MTPEAFEGDVARLRERFVDALARQWSGERGLTDVLQGTARAYVAALEAGAEEPVKHQHRKGCHRMALGHCDCAEPARQEPPPPVPCAAIRLLLEGALDSGSDWAGGANEMIQSALDHLKGGDCPAQRTRERSKPADSGLPVERAAYTAPATQGEPKRGRGVPGVEDVLRDMERELDRGVGRMIDVPKSLKLLTAARQALRAERAEAGAQQERDGVAVRELHDELSRVYESRRALQSTHEALVQRVRGVVERCQRVDMGAPSKYLALGIIADLTEGGGG